MLKYRLPLGETPMRKPGMPQLTPSPFFEAFSRKGPERTDFLKRNPITNPLNEKDTLSGNINIRHISLFANDFHKFMTRERLRTSPLRFTSTTSAALFTTPFIPIVRGNQRGAVASGDIYSTIRWSWI